ncbi:MAG: SSS family solute:Na+ symporter [Chlamydiales bacterium]|jgi:SSS family solute:Na+ symporter
MTTPTDPTPLYVVGVYLMSLVGLGFFTRRLFQGTKGTSKDYFVAGRSIGPVLLLMSVFGTTMTAFALVGSTGKSYQFGAGVYGLMASSSAILHSAVFFLVGIRLWAIGKRYDFLTQIQFFRARFDSVRIGYLLFPILVGLVIPYLLIGILGAGAVLRGVTKGMFPDVFPGTVLPSGKVLFEGSVPPWLTGLVICSVVLFYIFTGGLRAAAWANAFQTVIFMITGVIAFNLIADALGGVVAASQLTFEHAHDHIVRTKIDKLQFLSYGLVPLSVGMFPHLFQHWLTAKDAKTFRLTAVAHPIFIMVVWVPCILIGIWAAGMNGAPDMDMAAPGGNVNAILAKMVGTLLHNPYLSGLLTAGILAAIMSSLDSQFVCLGTMFTQDIVLQIAGPERFSDRQKILLGRGFIVAIVTVTYLLSLLQPPNIFDLAVWCFSGFASLFPLIFAALFWKRVTKAGAYASILAMVVTWSYLFYDGLIAPIQAGVKDSGEYLVMGMMPVAVIFAASGVALVVVSLFTTPPPAERVARFMIPSTRKLV